MRRFLLLAAGLVWFGLLFTITFFLTFPSDAVIERVRFEVADRSNGEYSLELDDLGPWWLGGSAQGVKLYQSERGKDPRLALLANDARVSASPFSVLQRAPVLSGSITPIDGTLYYTVGTARSEKKGDLKVSSVQVSGDGFPLSELLLLSGTDAVGDGGLNIDVDVSSTEGMKTATGEIQINGTGLSLSELELPGIGPLGMDVPIDELALLIKVDQGRADIQRGDILSPLLKAGISGNVMLRDNMDRSTMNVVIVLSDLGEQFQAFAPMLSEASSGGGKYTFSCSGTLGNPRCGMGEARTTSRATPRPSSRPSRAERTADRADRPERVDTEDLKKRREERLERLRKLREERAAEVADREERFDEEPEDEEEFLDEGEEEFLDDEEEFLDEEGDLFEE